MPKFSRKQNAASIEARTLAQLHISSGLFGKTAKNPHNRRKTINVEIGTAEALRHLQQNGIDVGKLFEQLKLHKNSLDFGSDGNARKNFATQLLLAIGLNAFSKKTLEMVSRLLFYAEAHSKAMALRQKYAAVKAGQLRLDFEARKAVEREH